jgi:Fur family transcriptional regulator, ferric uptake regulator
VSGLNDTTGFKFKLTCSQQAILDLLGDVPSAISAQDLYMMFRQRKAIGLATIYRSLEILKVHGLIKNRVGNQGEFLYSLIAKDTHYLTCLHCGTSIQLDRCPITSLNPSPEKDGRFKVYYHTLEFFGLCGDCHNLE